MKYSGKLFSSACMTGCLMITSTGCTETEPGPPPPPVMTADTPAATEAETDTSAPAATGTAERQPFDGLEFVVPAGWEKVALSQMQMGIISARFTMPAAPEVTLTLSRSGGGVEANIDRWRGQVEASRPEVLDTIRIANLDATMIDMEGRFAGGFGQSAQDGWRMIGIIVPLSDQGYFIKLTGPADQVKLVEEEFLAFAKSGQAE
ncbi:MAG: hypothetical protein WAO83_12880 [Fuerstiella sp.]